LPPAIFHPPDGLRGSTLHPRRAQAGHSPADP
jgi:hypothetical protein